MCKYTVITVKPAVRPPLEGIERFMGIFVSPTVEQNLGFACRHICCLVYRNIQQVRCSTHPHTAKSDFDTADHIEPLDEYLTAIECTVTVGVFKNQYTVTTLPFGRPYGISMRFDHPQPPAVILGKGDRAHDIGFSCSQ